MTRLARQAFCNTWEFSGFLLAKYVKTSYAFFLFLSLSNDSVAGWIPGKEILRHSLQGDYEVMPLVST